jgi:hypothetical protein
MFESPHAPLLPRRKFYARVRYHGMISVMVLSVSMLIGMLGYHFIEDLDWIDSYANAAMILSGMGPLNPLKTEAGKIFAGTYSLFSGVVFLTTVGFFLMPMIHRLLHRFHLESAREAKSNE